MNMKISVANNDNRLTLKEKKKLCEWAATASSKFCQQVVSYTTDDFNTQPSRPQPSRI